MDCRTQRRPGNCLRASLLFQGRLAGCSISKRLKTSPQRLRSSNSLRWLKSAQGKLAVPWTHWFIVFGKDKKNSFRNRDLCVLGKVLHDLLGQVIHSQVVEGDFWIFGAFAQGACECGSRHQRNFKATSIGPGRCCWQQGSRRKRGRFTWYGQARLRHRLEYSEGNLIFEAFVCLFVAISGNPNSRCESDASQDEFLVLFQPAARFFEDHAVLQSSKNNFFVIAKLLAGILQGSRVVAHCFKHHFSVTSKLFTCKCQALSEIGHHL
mmetsp:Transcript_60205/g.127538  ORF Transcript_60205/g.127538 Transcript_60205/m.127538 type:complete len:266 (+) Transcript_60205:133-930(+)